jgi:hypothetical protein
MWRPKDMCDVAQPIFVMWKYCGLPIFKVEDKNNPHDRKFVNGKLKLTHVILGVITVTLNIWFYMKYVGINRIIYSYISLIHIGAVFTQNIGILLYTHLKKRKIERLLANIFFTEKALAKFSSDEPMYKRVRSHLVWYLISQYLLTLSGAILECYVGFNNIFQIMFSICLCFGQMYNYNFDILLFSLLFVLKELNAHFIRCISKDKMIKLRLRSILRIHELLGKLAVEVNQTFQKLLLLKIFTDCMGCATKLYYGSYALIQVKTSFFLYLVIILANLLSQVTTWTSEILMAKCFEEFSEQVIQ